MSRWISEWVKKLHFHWCICWLEKDLLWKLRKLTFGAISGRSSMRILNGSSLSTWTCWFWDKFIFNLEVMKWIFLNKIFHLRIFSLNCSHKLGASQFGESGNNQFYVQVENFLTTNTLWLWKNILFNILF